jgi:hypothetical protein
MSDVSFPTYGQTGAELPLVYCETWAPFFETIIQAARSGVEYRTSQRGVLRRYSMKATVRAYAADFAILSAFFMARRGTYDSFLFVDPWDSVVRRVRFDDDAFPLQFDGGGVYSGTFDLVEVVN